MGTPIIGGSYSSADIAKMFLTGKGPMPALPPISLPIVDVDNVAEAHYRALMKPEAAGRRFVAAYDSPLITETGGWVTEKYGPQGYKTMTKTLGAFPMNCLACCSKQAAFYMQSYKK